MKDNNIVKKKTNFIDKQLHIHVCRIWVVNFTF